MRRFSAILIALLVLWAIAFSSAETDIEWFYYDVYDSLSVRTQEKSWIVEPLDEWNLTERERYIYQMGILEGYEWGYEDCLYRPQDQLR